MIYPLYCFFGSEGHVALDRNPGPRYDTLLLRLIPGDLLSACPHGQFHTLPGFLDRWAPMPNSYPNALRPMQGGSLYHFYEGLWYDPAGRQTHEPLCERRRRLPLSQPNMVLKNLVGVHSRKIHKKLDANPCSGLREVKNRILHNDT